eukprot:3887612-Prymnesium_polylepis.1
MAVSANVMKSNHWGGDVRLKAGSALNFSSADTRVLATGVSIFNQASASFSAPKRVVASIPGPPVCTTQIQGLFHGLNQPSR